MLGLPAPRDGCSTSSRSRAIPSRWTWRAARPTSRATGQSALAVLRAAHLVRTRTTPVRDEVETYHDRIREAVVAHLAPEPLRECHRRLAPALLVLGPRRPGDARRATSWARATRRARPNTRPAAAAKAAEALAFDRAASLYRFALTLRSEAGLEERRPGGPARRRAGQRRPRRGGGAGLPRGGAAAPAGAGHRPPPPRRPAVPHLSGHIEDGAARPQHRAGRSST